MTNALMKRTASAVLLAALLQAANAQAQSSAWFDTGGGQMRLVVEPPQTGAETVRAVLELELLPGWSTYWRDPGASGIPPQVNVDASAGVADARVHFPAPVWIDNAYGDYAGYYGSVSLPITMTRIADGAIGLEADVFLGICEDICIPVQTRFSLTVEPANGTTRDALRVSGAHDALPGAPRTGLELTDAPPAPPGAGYIAVAHSASDEAIAMFVYAPDGTAFKPPKVAMTGETATVYLIEPARPIEEARALQTRITVSAGKHSFETDHLLELAAP